jgi:uncharacterized membrane protein YdjX (TVP38/TMEM64 family)
MNKRTENNLQSRNNSKSIAFFAWLVVLAGYWWYTSVMGLAPMQVMQTLVDFVTHSPYGFPIYVLVYMARPLFLFPATLVTMTAGYLYGPVQGITYALIASNLSTMVAFLIGRFFGGSFLRNVNQNAQVSKYADRLRQDGFQTTLVLRFLFLPYDLVSYFSGFLDIDLRWFMLATILGSIPGTITFGMLGASIQGDFANHSVTFDPLSVMVSVVMFAISISLYRLVRRKEQISVK